jgi:hypothetical protein
VAERPGKGEMSIIVLFTTVTIHCSFYCVNASYCLIVCCGSYVSAGLGGASDWLEEMG